MKVRKNVLLPSLTSILPISILKNIVRIIVGVTLGSYLLLLLLTRLPAVQRWTAERVSQTLSEALETHVEMSEVRLGLFNRVVIDDLLVRDRNNATILQAARIGVSIDILDLLRDGHVHLDVAQLYSFDIHLRRYAADEPYSFQFITV